MGIIFASGMKIMGAHGVGTSYAVTVTLTNEIWFVGTVYEPNLWEEDKSQYQANY